MIIHSRQLAVALAASVLFAAGVARGQGAAAQAPEFSWPAPTFENRLWTRWWWLGNAVDAKNLTTQLEKFHEAGLGGVEICPIYGAYGVEDRYIDFLSPKWMEMLAHTSRETKRLGMGLDMTTGTGWPFGGSMVPDADASKGIVLKAFDQFPEKADLPAGAVIGVVCYPAEGAPVVLPNNIFVVSWGGLPPKGRYVIAVETGPQQKVKRPAPGAEGNVLDPYSTASLNSYLAVFDKSFQGFSADMPRSQFHDSFEYYQANWTPNFFEEFQKRRGYDLAAFLRELNNEGDKDTVARVKCDYRETLSDLHLEYMNRWVAWSHSHGMLGRNQAHGGPGNILDVYANADIPECEIFHLYDESQLPFLKLASSAAHVTGKRLASSESFTWLDEHFNASLAEVKPAADFLLLAGVNHMFLHGIPYSPEDAAWPGWNFYASVNFGPNGGLWRDFPAFTAYVARCQSILQANKPSNDVLLYVPWHQFWSDPANNDKLMIQFTTPGDWMKRYKFYEVASQLGEAGISYDETSDKMLANAKVADGRVRVGDGNYRVLVIPQTPVMPSETLKKIFDLANEGATVVFQGALPEDVPGYGKLQNRRDVMTDLKAHVRIATVAGAAVPGRGSIVIAENAAREVTKSVLPFSHEGLRMIARTRPDGADFFIVNNGARDFSGPLALGAFRSAVILDPRYEDRSGLASVASSAAGQGIVFVQLKPGESCFVRGYDHPVQGHPWSYTQPTAQSLPLAGTWNVTFIDGGPNLPKPFSTTKLDSWTSLGDDEAKRFAGTAQYTLTFNMPPGGGVGGDGDGRAMEAARASAVVDYQLNLGKVGDSARVTLNGQSLGTLWAEPFSVNLGAALKAGDNKLEIEVTNVAANRIADMDRRGVQWKIFRDANVLSTAYTAFDASNWPLRPAGLLGPVTLTPLAAFDPNK